MSLCHIIYKVIYFCNIVALEPFEGSSHQEEPVLDLCSLFSAHSTCIDRLLVTLLPPLDLSNVHSYWEVKATSQVIELIKQQGIIVIWLATKFCYFTAFKTRQQNFSSFNKVWFGSGWKENFLFFSLVVVWDGVCFRITVGDCYFPFNLKLLKVLLRQYHFLLESFY